MPKKRGMKQVKPIRDVRIKVAHAQGAANTWLCDHSYCKRVKLMVTHLLFTEYRTLGISQKEGKHLLKSLPLLLCAVGPWPPKQLTSSQTKLLFFVFCMVCVDEGASGLRGQTMPMYPALASEIMAARAAEAVEAASKQETPE